MLLRELCVVCISEKLRKTRVMRGIIWKKQLCGEVCDIECIIRCAIIMERR